VGEVTVSLYNTIPTMTRALAQPVRHRDSPVGDYQHFVLEDVSWKFYEQLLKEIGDRPIQVSYDGGRLEIMSPLREHEKIKKLIGRLIEMLTFRLNIEMDSSGSTTFRRREKLKGFEPDECYFIKNAAKMRGVKRWNPRRHPPPDLIVEVDITSRSIDREPIFAALGVPEVWRWDGMRLECLHLAGDHYVIRKQSLAFPFLEPGELKRFISKLHRRGENAIVREFVEWVKKNARIKT
jgi:Uma2 family endonuclease